MTDEQRQCINQAAHEIRTWGSVVVIGAGASLQRGFPLVGQLSALVWFALDADPMTRDRLALKQNWSGESAHEMIGDDSIRLQSALTAIAESPLARSAYQEGFARLNAERVQHPSSAHSALVEMLHRGAIETVVSLNWDTLLETAHQRLYGSSLRADGALLHKPHGDAADPATPWILPHESGFVPDALLQQVQLFAAQHPRVLLIVGYSESDKEVVDKLTGPLAQQWRVIRISPSARGANDINLAADEALPALVRAIFSDAEVSGWEYVTFETQRDLSTALSGGRLGPADVTVCPRLPEVNQVTCALQITKSAIVTGKSGSGKSITAYQAAYDFKQGEIDEKDWEVLRLVEPQRAATELLDAVSYLPHPTLAIVDDAQSVDSALLRGLVERANDKLAVIVVSTEDPQGQGIRVSGTRAVAVLAEALMKRRAETLSIVSAIDNRVGDNSYMDERLESRIERAACEETPWKFCFVLTRGERRVGDEIAVLRDSDGAELLLAAIALRQVISLDAGTSRDWLEQATKIFNRDSSWLEKSLSLLKARNVAHIESGESVFRCPHLQFATVALRVLCDQPRYGNANVTAPQTVIALAQAALNEDPPLRGVSWLLNELRFADYFRGQRQNTIISDQIEARLTERCWVAYSSQERRGALFALKSLFEWNSRHLEVVNSHADVLGNWLENVDATTAYAMGEFLNTLAQESRESGAELCDLADPAVIGASMRGMAWDQAYGWGYLLGRLAYAASSEWRAQLKSYLDATTLSDLSASITPDNFYRMGSLATGIGSFDKELSLGLVERTIPVMAQAISTDPVKALRALSGDIFFRALGYARYFFDDGEPSDRQKQIVRSLGLAVDFVSFGQNCPTRPGDWRDYSEFLIFLRYVMDAEELQTIYAQLAASINFNDLDRASQDLWKFMSQELEQLLFALALSPDEEPARSWVLRHVNDLEQMNSTLLQIVPEVVLERLRAGASLDLAGFHSMNWNIAILSLHTLYEMDESTAIRIAQENTQGMAVGFLLKVESPAEHRELPLFLEMMRRMAPEVLESALRMIDPNQASDLWPRRLGGRIEDQRAVAALLDALDEVEDVAPSLVELSSRLRAEFPQVGADYKQIVADKMS